jgi:hypothetical protein
MSMAMMASVANSESMCSMRSNVTFARSPEVRATAHPPRQPSTPISGISVVGQKRVEPSAIIGRMKALLVATPINPLQDINGLKRIDFVMSNGQIHRQR